MNKNTLARKQPFRHLFFAILWLLYACSSSTAPAVNNAQDESSIPQSQNNLLSIESAVTEIRTGDTFSVKVNINNTADLTAFELHMAFDSNMIEVVELRNGGFIAADFSVQNQFDNTAGTIDYAVAQIGRDPSSGSGSLLEVIFKAKTTGDSRITLRDTPAAPGGALLSDSNGQAIAIQVSNSSFMIK